MEHNTSWEDNSHSASQTIPSLLWYPKVHHRVHNSKISEDICNIS